MLPEPNPHAHIDDTLVSSGGLVVASLASRGLTYQSELTNKIANHDVDQDKMPDTSDDLELQPIQPGAVVAQSQARCRAQNNKGPPDDPMAGQPQAIELGDLIQSSIAELEFDTSLVCDQLKQSKNILDVDEVIEDLSRVLKSTLEDKALREAYMSALSAALQRQFDWLRAQEDQEGAIECGTEAIHLASDNHHNKPDYLSHFGNLWLNRFERLGELVDLDHAIDCQSRAAVLTPDGHPDKPSCLNNLGNSWSRRFERLGELGDIDRAIDCQSQAVILTPDGHPDKPSRLSNLGNSWCRRFKRLGELGDIDRAIDCQSQAVVLTPDGHPYKPGCLNNLGNSWSGRFERLGELGDLDHAMDCLSQAVALTPDGHPDKPSCLNNLGISWCRRFERLGELGDLDHAIGCQSQAVILTPDGHPDKPSCLNNLGNSWSRRFERLGELGDIDRAIDCQSQAVFLTPDGHPDKPGCLKNLGNSWSRRFERLGELGDLDHAIGCQSQAVILTPDGHPDKPSRLSNLGNSLCCRFERLGELGDIDRAIDCQSQAVFLTPDGHPDKPGCLNNLGNSWRRRFERLGELGDIDRAIECQSQAVILTPDGHPDKPSRLSNLGNSWCRRFERLGELGDIDRAIDCQSQAVFLTPDGHPDKPSCLNNLGISWCRRFERLGELGDIDRAIDCQFQAIDITPDGHPDKPSCLNNLGISWCRRFERLGELSDLDRAIDCQSQAIDITPDGHPYKPSCLKNLGNSWLSRFERLGELVDIEKACCAYRFGATANSFSPRAQMDCARMWARICTLLEWSPLEAYQVAFFLLPRLVWVGQTTKHRHDTMVTVRDLAAQAASWAISVNLLELALEWLEQGRSVVWGQTLQLRTPFEDLHLAYPELALRLQRVSSQLDAAASRSAEKPQNPGSLTDLVSEAAKHHRLADEWDTIIGEVRQLPGFTNFLKSLKSDDLKQAAQHGPIIIINTYHTQCDALIVLPGRADIIHVPLNAVQPDSLSQLVADAHSAMRQRGSFEDARGFTRKNTEDGLLPLLMWSSIVEPVLKALGYTKNDSPNELPYVTWCTTGTISQLPLHAAGMYDGQTPNAPDLVVSSYAPTLTALLWHKNPSSSQVGLLAVGQQASPGWAPLPYAVEELKTISKYKTVTTYHELDGASATVDATLAAMEENSWVHLACHAVQDVYHPSQSAFHLHDGPLTLEEIAKRQFKNKGLAFLSACETATGDRALPDEATHLAAGMLIAGYPSVIGTMWSIMDEDAPLVADIVYSELLKGGKMDHTQSARALHKAVKVLREKVGEKEIWRWAPFIHVGV
ncbi:CHAT domain protein [Ceratobasidium sp. AG-Ba]|nr:CHAT domain protein [Ceratobasidium sp. AG-Ba]